MLSYRALLVNAGNISIIIGNTQGYNIHRSGAIVNLQCKFCLAILIIMKHAATLVNWLSDCTLAKGR